MNRVSSESPRSPSSQLEDLSSHADLWFVRELLARNDAHSGEGDVLQRAATFFESRPRDSVLLTGPRVVGYFNDASDYDLLVFTDAVPASASRLVIGAGSCPVDCHMISWADFGEVAGFVELCVDQIDRVTFDQKCKRTLNLAYLVTVGRVLEPSAAIRFSYSIEAVSRLLSHWEAMATVAALAKAELVAESPRSTLHGSFYFRTALLHAIDCYSARRGQGVPSTKWRQSKFARSSPPSGLRTSVKRLLESPAGDVASYANVVRNLSEELIGCELSRFSVALERSHTTSLHSSATTNVLCTSHRLMQVDDDLVRLWRSVDGVRPIGSLAEVFENGKPLKSSRRTPDVGALALNLLALNALHLKVSASDA